MKLMRRGVRRGAGGLDVYERAGFQPVPGSHPSFIFSAGEQLPANHPMPEMVNTPRTVTSHPATTRLHVESP